MSKDLLYQPMRLGNHTVPGVWRYMLPYELQLLQIPREQGSSCDRCPRIHTDEYRPDYRCCTYHPRVPNFLLGMAARHDEGMRQRLQAMAEEGWLLPEGFQATPQKWAEFLAVTGEEQFGKTDKVLCPFLTPDNGYCSLYAFRNSVCSTFFCINDAGDRGHQFWDHLQDVVVQVEMALGQHTLQEVGFDFAGYIHKLDKLAKKLDTVRDKKTLRWNQETLKKLWGDRYGHEVETYIETAKIIERDRDRLWDIACEIDLLDASKFERASFLIVPKKYRDELDEEDYEDDVEAAGPDELWETLQKTYRKLWKIPAERLRLNERVEVLQNKQDDDLSKSYPDYSHEVRFCKRKGGKKAEWRAFISEGEAEALKLFANPCMLTMKIANKVQPLCDRPPEQFVAEWFARKVLVRD